MIDINIFKDYKKVQKEWGVETWIINTELFCCKLLEVNSGWECSLHMHPKKSEFFSVLAGNPLIRLGKSTTLNNPGDGVYIPSGTLHRFSAPSGDVLILEISTHHDDNDVVRLEPSGPIPTSKNGSKE